MLLCGILKYGSVFVTDERRERLLKLGFGTTLPQSVPLNKATHDVPSSSGSNSNCKSQSLSHGPNVLLTDEEVGLFCWCL